MAIERLALVVVAVLLATGAALLIASGSLVGLSSSSPAGPIPAHPGAGAAGEQVSETWLGVLVAPEAVDVTPRSDVRVQRMEVALGEHVSAGQRLATLDLRDLQRQASKVGAAVVTAEAEQRTAEAELLEQRERHERLKSLLPHVPAADVVAAGNRESVLAARVETAVAAVAERRAAVDELASLLAAAELRAPFDGVVAVRMADAGALVGPGHPLARILKTGALRVRMALPQGDAALVHVGDVVAVDVGGVAPLSGVIDALSPEIDDSARMVFAEARLEPTASTLPAGAVARISRPAPTSRRGAPQ